MTENKPSIIYNSSSDELKPKVYIGGRQSKLAVVQSKIVADTLQMAHPGLSFPVYALKTLGDNRSDKPLYSFEGKALWTKELEVMLLEKLEGLDQLDMIVHSLKDVPTNLPEGCELGAITKREDPRDALVMMAGSKYKTLADLPDGSIVGTSSIRRSAMIKRRYPHLKFESIRGNLQTRLATLDNPETPFTCIILAVAGLARLGLTDRITSYLQSPDMYHAVGQGALGIEIRSRDERIMKLLSAVTDKSTDFCCRAERELMRSLEGGCSVPIGVESHYEEETAELELTGLVVSVDGKQSVIETVKGIVHTQMEATEVGRYLAEKLTDKGAREILAAIRFDQI
ncbi:porphobilinogen deaminase [Trichomonascus vanleenenianus]|uniref:hydroxymethylbilane synthase n=1 Tax=Trichomonascus vanleenenianus TaxID=2268995 RepID=UPI003EC9CBA3